MEPDFALVGDAVAVGVGELPDARRGGDVERAVVPHGPFGEQHLVGEDGRLVEPAVAVGVLEADDAVGGFCSCTSGLVIGPPASAT